MKKLARRLVHADPGDRWAAAFGRIPLYTVTWVFRVLVLAGPVLAFGLTRLVCHVLEAQRRDEAEHGFETGRIVMSPEAASPRSANPSAPGN
jgi:ubiquinol-cytochrome c reductase cytochrome b subunit